MESAHSPQESSEEVRRDRSTDHAAVEAWEGLLRAQATLMRRFNAASVWQGRSSREYDVLYHLSRTGQVRQRDLTERLLMSQPSLSRVLDRLASEGLIERVPDPRDGRGSLLSLTTAGVALQRRIGARHAKDVAQTLRERLSDGDIEELRRITERLVPPPGDAPSS